MGQKKHVYLAMAVSFLAVLLNSFINLYLTPIITNSVGVEAYGFVSLAKNFTSYAAIIMAALNSYAARYMTIAYLQDKQKEYQQYFNTVLFGDLFIGGMIVIIGAICVLNLDQLLNIPVELVGDVKSLFILTFLTFYINTAITAYTATAYVKNRIEIYNAFKVLSYIAEIGILALSYTLFIPHVWYVGFATMVASIIILIGSVWMTLALIPNLKTKLSLFDKMSMKKLVINGFWNSANSVGNALNTGLDLLISNLMLNALSMGQVSIAKNISSMIYTLYLTISQPFQPGFLKKYSAGDHTGLIQELKYSMKVCGTVTNTVFAGFCVLGIYFYRLWIPTQDIRLVYSLTIIAMLPCISEGCVYPLYYIYTLTVKNKIPCIVTIIGGFCNVAAMYFLLKYTSLGVYSIVITTAVVMNVINLITNPLYMCHCLKVSSKTFYPEILLNVLCCAVALVSMVAVMKLFPIRSGWWSLLIHIAICGAIGLSLQLLIAFKPSGAANIAKKVLKRVVKND